MGSTAHVDIGKREQLSLRLLIVDDSPDDVDLLLLEFRRHGYDITHRSVQTADGMKQALADERWDAVLCDHSMPTLNAFEALAVLKESRRDIPFIIVSGMIGEQHAVDAMRAGCHDYVMKDQLARLVPALQRELQEAKVRRDRRRAKRALRRSEERIRQVVDSLPVALVSVEAITNRILLAVGSVQEILGYEHADFIGDTSLHATIIHEDDRAHISRIYQEKLPLGKPFEWEGRIVHGKTGQPKWIHASTMPVTDDEGNLVRQDVVILDINQRKEAEIEHSSMQDQLRRAQKLESVGVLAGGIAHDFNNLLTVISGNAQHLRENLQLSPDHEAVLDDIEAAALQAAEMTRSLQAFSRPARPHIRATDPNQLLEGIHRLLRRLIPATIDFRLRLDGEIDSVAVDSGQAQQLLVNLCVNARDAMPDGGTLEMSTRVVARASLPLSIRGRATADRYVAIEVSDTGIGMDANTLEHIFDPFFTTKPADRGTGLGLAVAHNIIEAHDGLVDVISSPGEGTRFTVFFPQITVELEPVPNESPSGPTGHERILVVEDEDLIGSLLKTVLETQGYRVCLSADPRQALDLVDANASDPFDLAIVDYTMPGMTGDRCVLAIQEASPRTRGLLMTGHNIDDSQLATSDCRVVYKPFSVPDMTKAVREVLDASPE